MNSCIALVTNEFDGLAAFSNQTPCGLRKNKHQFSAVFPKKALQQSMDAPTLLFLPSTPQPPNHPSYAVNIESSTRILRCPLLPMLHRKVGSQTHIARDNASHGQGGFGVRRRSNCTGFCSLDLFSTQLHPFIFSLLRLCSCRVFLSSSCRCLLYTRGSIGLLIACCEFKYALVLE